jgi:hypothetical protein
MNNNLNQQSSQPVQPQNEHIISNPQARPPKSHRFLILMSALAFVIVVIGLFFILHHKSTKTVASVTVHGCVSENLSEGSSGNCVSDAQSLINNVENEGYSECSFTNAMNLSINGTFDAPMMTQVASVQKWANCYAVQEGGKASLTVNGKINRLTWSDLCSFGYTDPKNSGNHTSKYYAQAITAGEDANCSSL